MISNEIIRDDAIKAAREDKFLFGKFKVSTRTITSNPFDRKNRKNEHILWHNEFRKERLIMGKGVL